MLVESKRLLDQHTLIPGPGSDKRDQWVSNDTPLAQSESVEGRGDVAERLIPIKWVWGKAQEAVFPGVADAASL